MAIALTHPLTPNPKSVLHAPDGRSVALKVHRCLWSGNFPENSLPAILECFRERVARAEIDFAMLRDADFLVAHDVDLGPTTTGTGLVSETTRLQAHGLRLRCDTRASDLRPPLLSEVLAAIREEPYPTLLELDVKDQDPWPWPRVEELARLVEPVTDRVSVSGMPDWNLRRLLEVDPTIPVGFDPAMYLDWDPRRRRGEGGQPRGTYGYLDAHPLARRRQGPTVDYLRDRLGGILRLVPGAREAHLRLAAFERMLDDGLANATRLFHKAGLLLDVWTLDAGTRGWRERLARAVEAGVDIVTTNTPRALAAMDLSRPKL
jgi:glycerophosphoryl diester phosphodiesterase